MRKITLSTSGMTSLFRGNAKVLAFLEEAEQIHLPVFVLAEMYYGLSGSPQERETYELIGQFLAKETVELISPGEETAYIFYELRMKLQKESHTFSLHDLWIAALAMESGSRLLTFNQKFKKIPGLLLFEDFISD